MGRKMDEAAYEPVDLADDNEFMDTGILYSDKEDEDKEQKDDADGE